MNDRQMQKVNDAKPRTALSRLETLKRLVEIAGTYEGALELIDLQIELAKKEENAK